MENTQKTKKIEPPKAAKEGKVKKCKVQKGKRA
jgi:hypothetical protein